MKERRRLTQAERRAVYDKTGGHCAYCGQEITLKQMQADHVVPLKKGGDDELGNMLPACASCNHYKSTLDLEQFRGCIERWPEILIRDSAAYKNAVRFGVVTPTGRPVVFYFERAGAQTEQAGAECSGGYAGRLAVVCRGCGRQKVFSVRRRIDRFVCNACGAVTPLEKMEPAVVACGCGKTGIYSVKSDAWTIRLPCPECGKPVRVTFSPGARKYLTQEARRP